MPQVSICSLSGGAGLTDSAGQSCAFDHAQPAREVPAPSSHWQAGRPVSLPLVTGLPWEGLEPTVGGETEQLDVHAGMESTGAQPPLFTDEEPEAKKRELMCRRHMP